MKIFAISLTKPHSLSILLSQFLIAATVHTLLSFPCHYFLLLPPILCQLLLSFFPALCASRACNYYHTSPERPSSLCSSTGMGKHKHSSALLTQMYAKACLLILLFFPKLHKMLKQVGSINFFVFNLKRVLQWNT